MWPHQNRILSQPVPSADQAVMKSSLPMVASSSTSSTLNPSVFFLGHKRSSQRQPPLLTNSEFGGKYVILEPLEASSLYMCIDKETLQELVCKVVPTRIHHDYLAGYLRMDGNPGVNTIESVFVGPKQSYVLFLPSHGDLHSYVRSRKRLPEAEAISLFHQIVSIVNDCHQNGICLRDLKLRKFVFRDPERTQLKLETLDDAVVLEDPKDDLLGEKHGCPVYCSPEILSSVTGRYSGRGADCWSLGVILYTMVVGRYPFHDANPTHLFGKICRGLFHIPPSISSLVRCIINSLLRKDPSERMTAQDLLACQLFSPKYMQTLERNNSPNSSLHL